MERWARSELGKSVRFMMVSMEGEGTAKRFNSMFKLMGVQNVVLEGKRGTDGRCRCRCRRRARRPG